MTYRLGTRIVLDEEKIKREGQYDLKKLYQDIDELAEYAGLIKKNKFMYICRGDEKDLAVMGIFNIYNLVEKEWFTKNVKEWTWINTKKGNTDMIQYCKDNNQGVWA